MCKIVDSDNLLPDILNRRIRAYYVELAPEYLIVLLYYYNPVRELKYLIGKLVESAVHIDDDEIGTAYTLNLLK